MNRCEHAETTVLLHLFGEAPPGYAEHLAGCFECQQSLAEHADTVDSVTPAFEAPRNRRRGWLVAGLGMALAASVLLSLGGPMPAPPAADTGLAMAGPPPIDLSDPLDTELDVLAGELDLLFFEMEL